jgi:hypothetical protein
MNYEGIKPQRREGREGKTKNKKILKSFLSALRGSKKEGI